MNTPEARAEARNRANRRLRRMTVGATALGIAATGALSLTAALSYDGKTSTGDAVALALTGDTGSSSTSSGGTSSSGTASATATPSTSSGSSSTSTTPSVTSSSGSRHASTGGS
jgi:hypothetical protein